jgi:hypothetical protein
VSLKAYGRQYKLIVHDATGTVSTTYSSSDFGANALRIRFEVEQSLNAIWTASISIWNLNTPSQTSLITTASTVELYAGYAGNIGLIFSGTVFQPVFEKSGPDYITTLICLLPLAGQEFSKGSISAGQTQSQFLAQVAASAKNSAVSVIGNQVRQDPYIRGKVWFGSVRNCVSQIARDNGLSTWRTRQGIAVGQVSPTGLTPQYKYAPLPQNRSTTLDSSVNYTLIGIPQQTVNGVDIAVQLDPRIMFQTNPPLQIQLVNSLINALPQQYGSQAVIPLQSSGVYAVMAVKHMGDTRDNVWATEIACVVPGGFGQILNQYNQTGQ